MLVVVVIGQLKRFLGFSSLISDLRWSRHSQRTVRQPMRIHIPSSTAAQPIRGHAVSRCAREPARSVWQVLIDVRRGVPLGVRAKRATVVVPTPRPAPGTAFPPRRLSLRGVPVLELNLWCGTCPALFKRLAEPESADLGLVNQRLSAGVDQIDDDVLRVYGGTLAKSTYTLRPATSALQGPDLPLKEGDGGEGSDVVVSDPLAGHG